MEYIAGAGLAARAQIGPDKRKYTDQTAWFLGAYAGSQGQADLAGIFM